MSSVARSSYSSFSQLSKIDEGTAISESRKIFTSSAKEIPENKPAMLLSAVYSGDEQRVYLKFYDEENQGIFYWRDRTNHQPYCYTKMEYQDDAKKVVQRESKYSLEKTTKMDFISDKEIQVLKVLAPDPLSIGGTQNSFRERVTSWEADIRYHENYLYDAKLIPGAYYTRKGDAILPYEQPISSKVQEELEKLIWNKRSTRGRSSRIGTI